MKRLVILLAIMATYFVFAQSNDQQISELLNQVARGQSQSVKAQIPNLVAANPNDPGVKLILAVVIDDAFKAVEIYNEIVTEHPTSSWADDAYWRIVQFYSILGDTTKARIELDNFRQKYPTSEYIIPASDVVRSAVGLAKIDKKRVIELGNVFNNKITKEATHQNKEKLKKMVEEKQTTTDVLTNSDGNSDGSPETNADNNQNTDSEENQESQSPMLTKKTNKVKIADNPDTLAKGEPDETTIDNLQSDINPETEKKVEDVKKVEMQETEKPLSAQEILDKQIARNQKEVEEFKKKKKEEYEQKKIDELNKIEEEEDSKMFFGLQVGLFNTREAAEAEMKKFLQQRMRTEVKTKMIDGEEKYAVVIGNYTSRASAESAKYYVNQQCNCNPIILEK